MMNGSEKKEINFEINLLPVISLLAVCISFLLLTTVWIHIGTVDVSQAFGNSGLSSENEQPPSLWVLMASKGDVTLSLKSAKNPMQSIKDIELKAKKGRVINFRAIEVYTQQLKKQHPKLTTALIMPESGNKYDDVIQVIERVRKGQVKDIGISPL